MGLLNWLFAKPKFDRLPDRIFLSSEAMFADILSQCRQELNSHERVLVVAHFPERLNEVRRRLDDQRLVYEIIDRPVSAEYVTREISAGILTLVIAEVLLVNENEDKDESSTSPLSILVVEHHPTRRHDEAIERFAAAVSGKVQLTYFAALDEPLMARFNGAWVTETLLRLGMHADECIESASVSRSLAGAQRKVEATAISDAPATSSAEWIERNLPGR